MRDQMVFQRHEIKYMLTKAQKAIIQKAMAEHVISDPHGRSTIQSLYFDTPDFLLIRRSMEHPLYKEKLRLRSYGVANANTTVFVELKKKYNSVVYKRRIAMTEAEASRYLLGHIPSEDSQIRREIDYCIAHYPSLAPRVLLSYEREAYYGKDNPNFRITFDETILWRNTDVNLTSGIYGTPILPEENTLMEIKTSGAIPLWMVRLLSENHIYKTSFSKYASAYTCICGGRQADLAKSPVPVTAEPETTLQYENGGNYHYA